MGLPGIDDLKGIGKKETAKRILKSDQAKAAFSAIAETETTLIKSVREQHETIGLDTLDDDDLPSKADRVTQLQQLVLAKIEDRFPAHVVETYCGDRLDHADEAADFAAIPDEEWTAQKETWAEEYRDAGYEGSDEELARAHVRSRYGVDLDVFEALVVNWPEGREAAELRNILASGLEMANEGINRTTAVLEEADVDIDADDVDDVDDVDVQEEIDDR